MKDINVYGPTGDQFILCTTTSNDPSAAFTDCKYPYTSGATSCFAQGPTEATIDSNSAFIQIRCANTAASCSLKLIKRSGSTDWCDQTKLYTVIGGSIGGFLVLCCLIRSCSRRTQTRYIPAAAAAAQPATQTIIMMQAPPQQQQQQQQPQQMMPMAYSPGQHVQMSVVPGSPQHQPQQSVFYAAPQQQQQQQLPFLYTHQQSVSAKQI